MFVPRKLLDVFNSHFAELYNARNRRCIGYLVGLHEDASMGSLAVVGIIWTRLQPSLNAWFLDRRVLRLC